MKHHPNEERLEKLYAHFSKGEFENVLELCSDDIAFTVPGHVSFSGEHTKRTFPDWIGKVWTISDGTFRETPELIVANDHHGTVLLTHYLTRGGKAIEYRTVHVWEIRDGRFTRWEEWPGKLEEFEAAWG